MPDRPGPDDLPGDTVLACDDGCALGEGPTGPCEPVVCGGSACGRPVVAEDACGDGLCRLDVYRTTNRLLAADGYAAVTRTAVARRLGIDVGLLRGQYPTRSALALRSLRSAAAQGLIRFDTGSLRSDLFTLLHHQAGLMTSIAPQDLADVLDDAGPQAVAEERRLLARAGCPVMRGLLGAARERGEVVGTTTAHAALVLALDTLRDVWVQEQVIGGDTVRDIVDTHLLPLVRAQEPGARTVPASAVPVRLPADSTSHAPVPVAQAVADAARCVSCPRPAVPCPADGSGCPD